MMITAQTVIDLVDGLIRDSRDGILSLPVFRRRTDPKEIWFELAFCISSSQERTRKAKAAAETLSDSFDDLCLSGDTLSTVKSALERRFISLRFMNRKSEQLADSWRKFRADTNILVEIDTRFESPTAAREYLVNAYAGIGPKQASMLLRNVGWGDDLAIIDSHIARISQLILADRDEIETYHSLEEKLRSYASDREITLEKLDVILWSCARVVRANRITEPALV